MRKLGWLASVSAMLGSLLLAAPVRAVQVAKVGGGVMSIHCAFSHSNFDDAIVHPGVVGSTHEHGYAGSSDTNANSTVPSMESGTSSCPLSFDTAGYWFPLLTSPSTVPCNAAQRGTYEPPDPLSISAPLGQCVYRPTLVNVYYRSRVGVLVQPFPQDLRMVAGGDTLNPPYAGGVQGSLSYSCVDSGPYYASPPLCPGKNGVGMNVHFPDCLLSTAVLGVDNSANMVYSTKLCPAGYIQLPRLSLHIRFAAGTGGPGWGTDADFMKGMTNGESLHADFWNTWNQSVLAGLVTRCLNGGLQCVGLTDANYLTVGS